MPEQHTAPDGANPEISFHNGTPILSVKGHHVTHPDYFNSLPYIERRRVTYDELCARAAKEGLPTPSIAEWAKTFRLTDAELRAMDELIEARRDSHCINELGPRFVIREYGNKARVGWFDDRGELVTMSFAEFHNAHIEKTVEIGVDAEGKPRRTPLTKYWLTHPLTRRYDRVEFLPGVEPENMPEGVLNLWRGWPMPLRPGWSEMRIGPNGPEPSRRTIFDTGAMPEGYCDMLLDHMLNNMCRGDEEVMHFLLAWMADALWNPGPCETAVILQGPQGSGKTFWAERFMEFFGIHALTLDDEDQVVGNFNKHLMNKSVIFADEAFFAGNRRHAAKLKTLITRPDLFVEPKGVDGFTAPKMFRLIMASNDDHVIRAERDDRRNLVLRVDAGGHNQDREYFARMHKEWREGGRTALFRWLTGAFWGKAVSNGQFRMWSRPVTAALQEQKDMSLPPAQMVVHNMLREGDLPCDFAPDTRNGAVFVPTRLLVRETRLKEEDEKALGDALRVLAGQGAKSVRVYLGEGRDRRQHRGFWLPPLELCRQRWEQHLGRAVAWPADVASWAVDIGPPENGDDVPF
ncbi:unnamed protein product [Symbiodinium necroappetens]|uniref:AAA+ ATPase domain-containing protein n=1 Tax=Symbiodinium necroappetens TaxID=1628268 RepID=A0A812RDV4_9DINO|nr:unnamed protein product [Symbiodinium necroappetens]